MSSSFLAIAMWIRSPGVESGERGATLELALRHSTSEARGDRSKTTSAGGVFSVRLASSGGRDRDEGLRTEGCQACRGHDMAGAAGLRAEEAWTKQTKRTIPILMPQNEVSGEHEDLHHRIEVRICEIGQYVWSDVGKIGGSGGQTIEISNGHENHGKSNRAGALSCRKCVPVHTR